MKCRLTINSEGSGWKDKVTDIADMTIESDTAVINYKMHGDDCQLIVSPARIEQTRRGNVNIKISFRQGQQTACILGDDGLHGGYAVFTKSLKVKVGKLGCNATLQYQSGNDNEEINLSIRAVCID